MLLTDGRKGSCERTERDLGENRWRMGSEREREKKRQREERDGGEGCGHMLVCCNAV